MNRGFGKDFYRKGKSVKRFGRFTEPAGLAGVLRGNTIRGNTTSNSERKMAV